MSEYLLEVNQLKMHFPVHGGIFRRRVGSVYAVDGVSFKVKAGETVGLVGESGCGKTTVGRSITRLYKTTAGDVKFQGTDIQSLNRKDLRELRRDLQIIFQDPFESLNSRQTVGEILEEPFIIHKIATPAERRKEVQGLLDRVGLSRGSLTSFPHEFSGGQRQRIGIARAIALKPKMIICDEPVSALDVSIQSQILNLLLELQQEMSLTYLFISHDLAVVNHISDRIAVMYLGKIVEYAEADILYRMPIHPYTHALISAIPVPDPTVRKKKPILTGDVPSPSHPPSGCVFHTRCPYVQDRCREEIPQLNPAPGTAGDGHLQACLRAGEITFE
ncbi:ABC transporter ATP-binding protein [Thermodesulfobacteriota bacterium]